MTLTLRPFQEEDVAFFLSHPRSGIWYEPRLGKTVVGTTILAKTLPKSVLIVCPKNALYVWRDHITEWFKHWAPAAQVKTTIINTKYTSPAKRQALWLTPRDADVNVFIVTYGSLLNDYVWLETRKLSFEAQIYDEYHKYFKSRKTKSFHMASVLTRNAKRVHPLSGTPTTKGPQEFWPVLNICNRHYFSSYWKFVNAFCVTVKNQWGGLEIISPRNLDEFHRTLERFGRVRLRKDVAPQMPKIQRSLLHIEMTDEQRRLYQQLQEDDFIWTAGDKLVVAASSMERILRLRQLLVCPAILDPTTGSGGAIEDLTDHLKEAPTDDERHVVIFTPFRPALDYFERHLRREGFENVWQLYGGLEPEDLHSRIKAFQASKGIILCTIKYAQAFSLCPAQTAYFIGYEWDPNDNKQAEDRLIPQSGHQPILAYYYSYQSSIDDMTAYTVNIRQETISVTLKSGQQPTSK